MNHVFWDVTLYHCLTLFLYSVRLLHFIWTLLGMFPCACVYVQVCINNHNKCPPTCDGVGWCSGDHLFSKNACWNLVTLTWCPCFLSLHTDTRHIHTKIIHHHLLIIHLLSSSCLTWYIRSMANTVIKRAKSLSLLFWDVTQCWQLVPSSRVKQANSS